MGRETPERALGGGKIQVCLRCHLAAGCPFGVLPSLWATGLYSPLGLYQVLRAHPSRTPGTPIQATWFP
eukprot:5303769-Pyramimonas_sp.AAC.1